MVNINLLPWREYEQEYQKWVLYKIFFLIVALIAIIIFSAHIIISQWEVAAKNRVALVNQKLNQFIAKPAQLSHPSIRNKSLVENKRMSQDVVCFTGIERVDKTFSFTGEARSLTDLTEFFRQWHAAYFFAEIQIKLIEQQKNGLVKFGFQAKEI